MPLLGFKSHFADAVENGVAALERRTLPHSGIPPKRQTIRARRRDGRDPRVGDVLHLYTGLRTRGARKLGVVACRRVERVRIDPGARVRLGSTPLDPAAVRRLARADGFPSTETFLHFFESVHGLPFDGWLIQW